MNEIWGDGFLNKCLLQLHKDLCLNPTNLKARHSKVCVILMHVPMERWEAKVRELPEAQVPAILRNTKISSRGLLPQNK